MASKKLLSESALQLLKHNPEARRELSKLLNRSVYTIGAWIRSNDSRLTIDNAVKIISETTGLNSSEVLVELQEVAA